MELHEIRYFLALCETLNFTRAAELCHVTQPALTRAIRSLEEKLGGQLVHRERGNTHLTELGRLMQPYFVEMKDRMERAKRRAEDFIRLKDCTLRVGVMCTIGPSKLVDLFGDFHRRHEGIELFLKDGPAGMLEEGLAAGDLDVAIFSKPDGPLESQHALPLYSERFVIGLAPDHPLARLEAVRLRDLHGQSYLSRVNCEFRDHIREIRESLGVVIRQPYRSERDDWIQCMTLAGLGFTVLPEFSVTVPGLVTRPLVEPEFHRQVNVVTVRGRPHSPGVGAFVMELRRYAWAEELRRPPTEPPERARIAVPAPEDAPGPVPRKAG